MRYAIAALIALYSATAVAQEVDTSPVLTLEEQIERGGVVMLPVGVYKLTRTVRPEKPFDLIGVHPAATIIDAPKDASAFEIAMGAKQFSISSVTIRGRNPMSTETPTYGVVIAAPMGRLDRVIIREFVQPLRIKAAARVAGVSNYENANGVALDDVWLLNCAHDCAYVDGPDTNMGTFVNVKTTSGCLRASRWETELGRCGCVVDSSFLGNTWVGGGVHDCAERVTVTDASGKSYVRRDVRPGVIAEGLNQRSTFVGFYIEADAGKAVMARLTTVLGGHGGWIGPGLRIQGQELSGGIKLPMGRMIIAPEVAQ